MPYVDRTIIRHLLGMEPLIYLSVFIQLLCAISKTFPLNRFFDRNIFYTGADLSLSLINQSNAQNNIYGIASAYYY